MHDLLTNTRTEALYLSLWVALPVVGVAFLVALLLGLVQSFTQLTEPTLNAIPRAFAVFFTLGLAGVWMGHQLSAFAGKLLQALPNLVR